MDFDQATCMSYITLINQSEVSSRLLHLCLLWLTSVSECTHFCLVVEILFLWMFLWTSPCEEMRLGPQLRDLVAICFEFLLLKADNSPFFMCFLCVLSVFGIEMSVKYVVFFILSTSVMSGLFWFNRHVDLLFLSTVHLILVKYLS